MTNTSIPISTGLPELEDEWPDEKKFVVIEKVYKELPDHRYPVSISTARQKTIPEVRIIEGLANRLPGPGQERVASESRLLRNFSAGGSFIGGLYLIPLFVKRG